MRSLRDSLKQGLSLRQAGPINTEAEGSLHIKDKSAANSTIFLVCRPRTQNPDDDIQYWEDLEPLVAQAVRKRVGRIPNRWDSGR
jgi:adenine-specific DNA methylase